MGYAIFMNRHKIIQLPHPNLSKRSKEVELTDKALDQLISDMEAATLDWEDHREHEFGVALAAVQINKLKRVIIIRNNLEDKSDRTFKVYINPKITRKEGEPIEETEGCLSVPDLYGTVPRYPKVKIKALDEDGRVVKVNAKGFLARVFQHEIDHADGKTFIDRVENKDKFFKLNSDGKLIPIAKDELNTAMRKLKALRSK